MVMKLHVLGMFASFVMLVTIAFAVAAGHLARLNATPQPAE